MCRGRKAGIPNLTTDPHGQNGLNQYERMQEDTKGEKLRYENESFRIRGCMYEVNKKQGIGFLEAV
jgi:hypothetical protein